ncbi:ankyrin repeat-containing protein C6C3.08 [Biomphalaria glabrata]
MAKDPAELLRMKDLQGLTPLRKAVALNKAEIARILVAYGAEPSVRDPAGRTVLHIAVMQGRRELIAPLLVSKDSCVNVQDSVGCLSINW